MTALIAILGGLLVLLGLIGCVVPVLPGPLLAYAALWLCVAFGVPTSTEHLVFGGVAVLVAMAVDYILPTLFAKKFKCSKSGVFGCMLGTVVGLFFMPLGIVVGPFLGTVAGELIVGKSLGSSLKGGVGAFFGFIACLLVKFAAVTLIAYWFATAL